LSILSFWDKINLITKSSTSSCDFDLAKIRELDGFFFYIEPFEFAGIQEFL
jgi:hypothetical protein